MSQADLLQALEKQKQTMRELVDEVVFLEQDLSRSKDANARLLAQFEEARLANVAIKQAHSEVAERLAEYENGNAVRSLKQMLVDQQNLYQRQSSAPPSASPAGFAQPLQQQRNASPMNIQMDRRLASLEGLLSDERRAREEAEQRLAQVHAEIQLARDQARMALVQSSVTKTEAETERDQRRDLRDEFSRAQRNNEAAAREQRANEKRYDAILDELHQVMEERDLALLDRDESRRLKSEEERVCQQQKLVADEARAARDAALERALTAERGRDLAITQKDAEERQRLVCFFYFSGFVSYPSIPKLDI